ncbi:WAS/WASL-interacting protein family member 1 [Hylobates moloch]|uniref:WAS/WASL-interacting protein family member 1 n=1 Tax=Hylobates moloch TaxID=81572 RepID=UPI002676CEE1|nr:WAS/WASL-interacting protein family member 1 [Hylobates moloch]
MRGRERAPTQSHGPPRPRVRAVPSVSRAKQSRYRGGRGGRQSLPLLVSRTPPHEWVFAGPPLLHTGTSHAAGGPGRSQHPGPCSPLRADAGSRGAVGTGPHPQDDRDPLAGPRGVAAGAEPPVPPEGETKPRRTDPGPRPRTLRSPARSRHARGSDPRPVRRPCRQSRRLTSGRRLAALPPRSGSWADWSAAEQPTEPRPPQQWSPGAGPPPPPQPVSPARDPARLAELQPARGCGRDRHRAGAHSSACRPPSRPQRSLAPRARPPANGERAVRSGRGLGEQREVGRGGARTGLAESRGRTRPNSRPDLRLLEYPAQRLLGVGSAGHAHLKPRAQAFRAESERQACFTERETEVQGIGLPAARSQVVPFTRSSCSHSANIWKHVWTCTLKALTQGCCWDGWMHRASGKSDGMSLSWGITFAH